MQASTAKQRNSCHPVVTANIRSTSSELTVTTSRSSGRFPRPLDPFHRRVVDHRLVRQESAKSRTVLFSSAPPCAD
jgi:hypothetical protein